jgi:DNA mismatch repair protein MSH6
VAENDDDLNMDLDGDSTSTAQQWRFDPNDPNPTISRIRTEPKSSAKSSSLPRKEKAHEKEPEKRHDWLQNLKDADKNPIGHPDYDPRTIFVPLYAWKKFSAFEEQYWNIKKNLWDTVVFFKKGKFYELYENDATIGHQLFDLKLTDRVNMRMVGVPESSLDMWANQFVAKGYKVARVDQMESALGKEMRERNDPSAKAESKKANEKTSKIIHRELASVLTSGTLVDGSMLQDDMSTYCVAIKVGQGHAIIQKNTVELTKEQELIVDGVPSFGVAFVDAATARFHVTEFLDDPDMTKFETIVAQARPQELLLEKVHAHVYTTWETVCANCIRDAYRQRLFGSSKTTPDRRRFGITSSQGKSFGHRTSPAVSFKSRLISSPTVTKRTHGPTFFGKTKPRSCSCLRLAL